MIFSGIMFYMKIFSWYIGVVVWFSAVLVGCLEWSQKGCVVLWHTRRRRL